MTKVVYILYKCTGPKQDIFFLMAGSKLEYLAPELNQLVLNKLQSSYDQPYNGIPDQGTFWAIKNQRWVPYCERFDW